jgi:hypothetical protein
MTPAADRRAVLGTILAGAGALALPSWACGDDPVYRAIEAHREAYDAMAEAWDASASLRWLTEPDEAEKAELHRVNALEMAEEETHNALLAIMPATKASAIACVQHIAEYGLASTEMQAWLLMLLDSPLVA